MNKAKIKGKTVLSDIHISRRKQCPRGLFMLTIRTSCPHCTARAYSHSTCCSRPAASRLAHNNTFYLRTSQSVSTKQEGVAQNVFVPYASGIIDNKYRKCSSPQLRRREVCVCGGEMGGGGRNTPATLSFHFPIHLLLPLPMDVSVFSILASVGSFTACEK